MAEADPQRGTRDGPVVFARVIDAAGVSRSIDWHRIKGFEVGEGELLWVHIDRGAPELKPWLRDELGLSDPTIEALTADAKRPRSFREGNAVAAILRGVGTGGSAEAGDLTSMQLWSDGSHVITLRRNRLHAAAEVLGEVDDGNEVTSAGDLVARLLEETVAQIGDIIGDMNDQIDALEEGTGDRGAEDKLTLIRDCARPDLVARLRAVVEGERGHALAGAVEAAKIAASEAGATELDLGFLERGLAAPVDRAALSDQTGDLARAVAARIGRCLAQAGLAPERIDALFLTGGSTGLPHLRAALTSTLPAARVVEGDTFGSVGLGLTIEAARRRG